MQRGIGSVPALREHQAGTHQLPCASLLLSLRHSSGPQKASGPGPSGLGRVPDGETHMETQRERDNQIAGMQTESHGGDGEEKAESMS